MRTIKSGVTLADNSSKLPTVFSGKKSIFKSKSIAQQYI